MLVGGDDPRHDSPKTRKCKNAGTQETPEFLAYFRTEGEESEVFREKREKARYPDERGT